VKLDRIAAGEWLPDLPDLANPGALEAKNVIPWKDSYKPFNDLNALSVNALGARCQGAYFARDNDGNVYNFAGDATKLYLLQSTSYSDVTRVSGGAYATPSDGDWEMTQWGSTVIAVNGADAAQVITLGNPAFTALGGSPPVARHIAVVRDFVVMGNISGSPNRVQWSAIGDSADWAVSTSTLADFQDLQGDGGWVAKIIGGEIGVVFRERDIWRMTFTGSREIFQFDQIEKQRGTFAPQSVINYGSLIFYLADDGFYVTNGSGNSIPIGDGKVDRTLLAGLDTEYFFRISAAIDPTNKLVMWAVPFSGSTGNPNRIFIYNWVYKRWAYAVVDLEVFARYASQGYTLEGLDAVSSSIDSLSPSLDSRVWTGGLMTLAAFNTSHKIGTFSGSVLAATVDTGEVQHYPGFRSNVSEVRPLVAGGASTITVGSRNLQSDSNAFGAATSQNASGTCPVRSNARYHRYRIQSSDFDFIQGAEAVCEQGDYR
jgi:hypothetical protein